jgi:hypothetical protein
MHKRLIAMIEKLANCIEPQFDNLEEIDCCELGEAVDILKDLEETLYFHTITEAMKDEGVYGDWPVEYKKKDLHEEAPIKTHEEHTCEGRSCKNRKVYMEMKHTKDKAAQMRELEKYMQELTTDMIEMIEDSSPEEKQYLEKKITALGAKIGAMK